MTKPSLVLMAHKSKNPTHIPKCLPRMSWSPANLYNLYQRTYGPPTIDTKFTKSSLTLYQQKWKAKQLTRAYHGDWIIESKFKKMYLPDSLPPISGNKASTSKASSSTTRSSSLSRSTFTTTDKVPLTSLMFAEIEKRLDTVVFRCCFADSIYRARMTVVHGNVTVNGHKIIDPNTRLRPGDLISVRPESITTLQRKKINNKSNDESESSTTTTTTTEEDSESSPSPSTSGSPSPGSPSSSLKPLALAFHLPNFAAPFLFVPTYLEISWTTCSAVYLRDPEAGPGYSEIPSPYEADGELMKLTWEYYAALGRKGGKRSKALIGKRLGA